MGVTFLIGNGFDLNLGMKTRYTDMYDSYIKSESKSTVIFAILPSERFLQEIRWPPNDKRNRPKRVFHKSATITNYNLIT